VAIWYRFSWFGMLCEEKFGNPGCLLHPACIPVFLPEAKLRGKPFLTPLKKLFEQKLYLPLLQHINLE
jgi:hypothetical protein